MEYQPDEDLEQELNLLRVDKKGELVSSIYRKETIIEEEHMMVEQVQKEEKEKSMMACLPWIGALVAPTKIPPIKKEPPTESLTLEYINGYRTEETRNNMYEKNKLN